MIPLCVPNLAGNERAYLNECIDTTFVSTVGPFVGRFERAVADAVGAKDAVATASGTCALHLALLAVGVRPGDLVVLPSFTFIASANAISHCGASPWLFDVAGDSWTLDAALLDRHLAFDTERTAAGLIHRPSGKRVAAIMPVYTLGMPADMDAIVAVARAYGLPVVADSAAAIGATYKGRPLGQLGADLSAISFNGNKTVTTGGGGAVVGNDEALLATVRHLSSTARVGRNYDHDRVGFNYRMTNLQAAVGCAQMERVDEFIAAKRRIHATYCAALADLPGVSLFPNLDWTQSACWFSGIVLSPPAPTAETVRECLVAAGIEARAFWRPMHQQIPYADTWRTDQTVAEGLWERVVTLPCSTQLSADDQQRVISALRGLF